MIKQQHCQVWVLQISIYYRPGSWQYAMNCNDMTNTMSSLSSVLCRSLAGTVEVMFSHDLIRESAGAVFAHRVARRLLQSSTLGYHRISVFLSNNIQVIRCIYPNVHTISLVNLCAIYICMYTSTCYIHLYTCTFVQKCMQRNSRTLSALCSVYFQLATFTRVSLDFISSFSWLVIG